MSSILEIWIAHPSFFIGSSWVHTDKNFRSSNKTFIKERDHKFEDEHGLLRKESSPAPTKLHSLDHPKKDSSPLLDDERNKMFQSIIGAC